MVRDDTGRGSDRRHPRLSDGHGALRHARSRWSGASAPPRARRCSRGAGGCRSSPACAASSGTSARSRQSSRKWPAAITRRRSSRQSPSAPSGFLPAVVVHALLEGRETAAGRRFIRLTVGACLRREHCGEPCSMSPRPSTAARCRRGPRSGCSRSASRPLAVSLLGGHARPADRPPRRLGGGAVGLRGLGAALRPPHEQRGLVGRSDRPPRLAAARPGHPAARTIGSRSPTCS